MIYSALLLFSFLFAPKHTGDIPASIYDFKVAALDGNTIDFAKYKGKKIMIVNTASKCGYTPQYADLEAIYEKYKGKLVIIGFPANNFLFQEPGSNSEISGFCQKNYGVTFPMAAKVSVKGHDMALLYQWLTNKKYNNYTDDSIQWNFQKYLIDENGNLVGEWAPKVKPNDPEIIAAIEK